MRHARFIRRSGTYAITILLFMTLIATGIAAYHFREQWWALYLSYIHK